MTAITLIVAGLLVMELFAHCAGAAAAMIGTAMKKQPKQSEPVAKLMADALAKRKTGQTKEQRSEAAKKGWATRRAR